MLLHLRFPGEGGGWGLYLPFFLLYPLLLALFIVALPVILLLALVLWPAGKGLPLLQAVWYLWVMLFKMQGLKVDIMQGASNVLVEFV
jgi:hypothetical protein